MSSLPAFPGASLIGQRVAVRAEGASEAPAAYEYYRTSGNQTWAEIRSHYQQTLASMGWAVRANAGVRGGLGFSRGGYSGFLAATPTSQEGQVSYYLFLGALA
jgi:hypothetical protein